MTYTVTNPVNFNNQGVDTSSVTAQFQNLSTDDKLNLLWVAYTEIGHSITPTAPGAARLQFAKGLLNQVKQMSQTEQLQVMRDLVDQISTPITRAYGTLTDNTKLAFWNQLAKLIEAESVIPFPSYQLSQEANSTLLAIQTLDLNQQITVLRNAVTKMGVDPLG
ncbi:MAG: orange carotenoid protein N-terminal domain-containing protein [Cyanobacteria bacterium P01_G01_bin.49]